MMQYSNTIVTLREDHKEVGVASDDERGEDGFEHSNEHSTLARALPKYRNDTFRCVVADC
jgi:hypothetical protein